MSTDLTTSIASWKHASIAGTFEESMAALEAIVSLLDSGELTLDQSLECFELGARLSHRCQQLLEQAELRVEMVQRSLESETAAEPPF
ncbi:MAG: exodeoxyribonuclease VII small subunit [Thermomicrobiales bacterium]|nr:MAG: exodeoxyribonuclease VII small subunit [Thermomicrobiales bacterium]